MIPGYSLLGNKTRRQIARACEQGPLTSYGLGKKLGRAAGSLENVLDRMVSDRILTRLTTPRGTTNYKLTRKGSQALASLSEQALGVVSEGQRLLVVAVASLPAQREALRAAADSPAVLWAARIDGSYRYLIALDGSSAEIADELEGTLLATGAQCAQGRVDVVVAGEEFARLTARSAEVAGVLIPSEVSPS